MATLQVEDGKKIYFEHYKSGNKTPVLLINGWGASVRVWDLTLPALLKAGHEVVVFDQRGCGKSDKDFADVSVQAIASDAIQIIEATGINRPALLGWSFGAAVAVEVAAQVGALSALLLVGPPTPKYLQAPDYPYGGTAEILEQTLSALSQDRPNFLRGLAQGMAAQDLGNTMVDWLWQMLMQTSPVADESMNDLGRIDHREILPKLTVPTAVYYGAKDAIIDPEIARVCAALVPNSELLEFAESGHAPFLEESSRFNDNVVDFLRKSGEKKPRRKLSLG
ncbi:alpha/beta hydrolase (plasmid) [Rhodococcus opacus]|uniref:alpha/beta fold hydrolase n=1 Tax=Rhodococcus opacus TaxID=37919 RepID=UPI0034D2C5F1